MAKDEIVVDTNTITWTGPRGHQQRITLYYTPALPHEMEQQVVAAVRKVILERKPELDWPDS